MVGEGVCVTRTQTQCRGSSLEPVCFGSQVTDLLPWASASSSIKQIEHMKVNGGQPSPCLLGWMSSLSALWLLLMLLSLEFRDTVSHWLCGLGSASLEHRANIAGLTGLWRTSR